MDESSQGTMEGARSQVQDVAESAREGAAEAKGRAGEQVRQQVDTRSTQVGEGARTVADAIRRTSGQLREEGNDMPAKVLDASAERIERLGSYLEGARADELLDRVEDFARRQTWVVAAGSFAVGLVTSRLLKASSTDRFQRRSGNGSATFAGGRQGGLTTPGTDDIPPAGPVMPDVPAAGTTPRGPF